MRGSAKKTPGAKKKFSPSFSLVLRLAGSKMLAQPGIRTHDAPAPSMTPWRIRQTSEKIFQSKITSLSSLRSNRQHLLLISLDFKPMVLLHLWPTTNQKKNIHKFLHLFRVCNEFVKILYLLKILHVNRTISLQKRWRHSTLQKKKTKQDIFAADGLCFLPSLAHV